MRKTVEEKILLKNPQAQERNPNGKISQRKMKLIRRRRSKKLLEKFAS